MGDNSSSALHTDLAQRAAKLLGDGEWHPYEKTIRALMKAVTPSIALRRAEQDRTKLGQRRTRGPGQPRIRARSIEDQQYSGARGIVRDFLRSNAFETNKPGSNKPGGNYGRMIRMTGELRALKGDPYRLERDKLKIRNEELTNQVRFLRAFLVQLGHKAVADQIAPMPRGYTDPEFLAASEIEELSG